MSNLAATWTVFRPVNVFEQEEGGDGERLTHFKFTSLAVACAHAPRATTTVLTFVTSMTCRDMVKVSCHVSER